MEAKESETPSMKRAAAATPRIGRRASRNLQNELSAPDFSFLQKFTTRSDGLESESSGNTYIIDDLFLCSLWILGSIY